jgi:hypothetical protein
MFLKMTVITQVLGSACQVEDPLENDSPVKHVVMESDVKVCSALV